MNVNVCVCMRVCVRACVNARARVRAHCVLVCACLYLRARACACVRMLSRIASLNQKFIILVSLYDPLFTVSVDLLFVLEILLRCWCLRSSCAFCFL